MTRLRPHPLVLLLMLAVSGCQLLGAKALPPGESPAPVGPAAEHRKAATPRESPFTPGNLQPEEIPGEISNLALISLDPQNPEAERAEALRRMALLHLAARNPARSLALAAKAQTDYLNLLPPGPSRQEGEIWLALVSEGLAGEQLLLRQSQKNRKKEGALTDLGEENQRLAQKLDALEKLNANLKEDIERLKFIDLSMEKKRKNLR